MKVVLIEIKKNPQETHSGGDEAAIQINNLEHKEEKEHSIKTARRKKNSKNKNRIRSLWDISKCTNIKIIGMPEEEEEQEIENLSKKKEKTSLIW